MIEVTYYRNHNRVTIQGHALSNEYGKDLVCAACSTLAVTLAANIRYLESKGYVTEAVSRLDPGEAELSCAPATRYRDSVRQMFMAVCVGFEVLADQYPDYIRYEIHG